MQKLFWGVTSLLWTALIYRLTTTPNLVVAPENWANILLMNGAHFGFFGIQAVLLKQSLPTYANRLTIIVSILLTSLFGYYIEVLQRNIPGRSYDIMDWVLDTLGAIIFVLVFINLDKRYNLKNLKLL